MSSTENTENDKAIQIINDPVKHPVSKLKELSEKISISYTFSEFTKQADDTFCVNCYFSNHTSSGTGKTKAESKLNAAVNMLNLVKEIPLSFANPNGTLEKLKNDYVSKLYEKGKEHFCIPIFDFERENGKYKCTVKLGTHDTFAIGNNKKEAKQECCKQLLNYFDTNGTRSQNDGG